MSKRKNSTKEEREKCIQDFLASRSTQRTWCEENHVSLATFKTWLAEYKSNHQETKFIPLSAKNKSNPSYIPKPQEILIEIGACKIHVSEQAGLQLIMQAIKGSE